MGIIISDDSEFQGVINPVGQEVVIIRAYNGYRADNDFAASRANCQRDGVKGLGIYAYLVASRDAAQQARELLAIIGTLAPNEWLICDLEEGGGNEQPRWQAWRQVVMAGTGGRMCWLYSGLSFAQSTNLQPDWVAAYQGYEPVTSYHHKLWQNSDNYPFPWARTDESVYDGTLAQFLVDAGIIPSGPVVQPISKLQMEEENVQTKSVPNGPDKALFRFPAIGKALPGTGWARAWLGLVSVGPDAQVQVFLHNGNNWYGMPGQAWLNAGGVGPLKTGNPVDMEMPAGTIGAWVLRMDASTQETVSIEAAVWGLPA